MNFRNYPYWLYFIIVVYLILSTLYSIVTPIFEMSDELWHYPVIHYMANNGLNLPEQNPDNVGIWRQEGSQPPLYYLFSALLTLGIDTSDIDKVRRINSLADIGTVNPDGNANMMLHNTEDESFPWQGTTLAVHIVRFFSIILGACTIIVTYHLALEIFPDRPDIAMCATAVTAFLPMFVFISASVNNDNLANLLGNLLMLSIVRLLKSDENPHWKTYVFIGVITGMGLLSKLSIGFILPLIALSFLILTIRSRNLRPLFMGAFISGGLTIIIAGWWYLRNLQLYGDPTGLDMFLTIVGRRAVPADLIQLWSERNSFTQSYWGLFGGVNVPLPPSIYTMFNIIGGIGLLGTVIFIMVLVIRKQWSLKRWLYTAITVIWPILTFISYLRWASETPASAGRLMFGALSSLSIWMSIGIIWWIPKRLQKLTITGIVGYFLIVTVIAPFTVIIPTYSLPNQISSDTVQATFIDPQTTKPVIGLSDVKVLTNVVHPSEYVEIETSWQLMDTTIQDWAMFIHLVTPDGVLISQRDIYPGQGRLATSDLQAGFAWKNFIAVKIPPTAFAPNTLEIKLGWYHLPSGQRLMLDGDVDSIRIGQVDLISRADPSDVPNPIHINFNNQIELLGYDLSDLSPEAGASVELTLYWQALVELDTDYVVFANILDLPTLTKYASSNAMPVQWQAPTSTWEVGHIVIDTHSLNVTEDAPSGNYELEVGLYTQDDEGKFHRLNIFDESEGLGNNRIHLSRVRIAEPAN